MNQDKKKIVLMAGKIILEDYYIKKYGISNNIILYPNSNGKYAYTLEIIPLSKMKNTSVEKRK